MQARWIKATLRKTVCTVMSASIALSPTWAFGGETNMSALAKDAQKEAQGMAAQIQQNLPTMNGTQLNFAMPDGKTMTLDKSDFDNKSDQVQHKYDESHLKTIEGYWDSGSKLTDKGEEEKKVLFEDATSDNPTVEGHAYAVVKDLAEMQKVDLTGDAMFGQTNKILESIAEYADELSKCTEETKFVTDKTTEHVTDYRTCNQVLDRSGSCKIYHQYEAGVIRHHSGPYNIKGCGEGCTQVWLGTVGDNYLPGGSCKLFTEEVIFTVANPDAITKVELDYAAYDDQMQVWVGPPKSPKKVYEGPNWGAFPFEDFSNNRRPGTTCELNTHWIWDPYGDGFKCTEKSCKYTQQNLRPINITDHIKKVGKNGQVRFFFRDAVGGHGEAFARMKIYYDPAQAVHDEAWTPTSCLESAYGVQDGFAKGSYRCTKMPPVESDGCAWFDGVKVCPQHLNPSPLPSISNLCQQVDVTSNFDFYKGEMDCWTDINGNRQCPTNTGGVLDNCKKYADNPKCGFISSNCVDGARGGSGQCYVTDIVYDCGEDVVVDNGHTETTYKCAGAVSCMGNECFETETTVNKDFGKVTALLNAAQYMTKDMTCTGIDDDGNVSGAENITCSVFGGEAGECKIAVGGVSDCCESQGGVGLASYIKMLTSVSSLDNSVTSLEAMEGAPGVIKDIAGSYVDMKGDVAGVIKDGISYVSEPFASYVDNVAGTVKDFFSPATEFIAQLKKKLMDKCTDLLTKLFQNVSLDFGGAAGGSAAAGSAQQAAQQTANTVMAGATAAFAVISAIYTAYVVATMIIQMVYKCTKDEMELTAQRELKNCHYIGSYCKNKKLGVCIEKRQSYCCYSSPLSRIMNEQIRKQGATMGVEFDGFGTAKRPKCDGIPLDKIDKIDWDKVDLSEWLAILKMTGNFPDNSNIDIESLTGSGSKLDIDGDRQNTIDRLNNRLDNINVDELRTEGSNAMDVDVGSGAPKSSR